MNTYIKDNRWILKHWESSTGYGLALGNNKENPTVILPPLLLMAFTFKDEEFSCEDFKNFLLEFPETNTAVKNGLIEPQKCLDNLVKRGLLNDSSSEQFKKSLSIKPEMLDEDTPVLKSLYIYGTNRCTHRCYHCYQKTIFQKDDKAYIDENEITTEQTLSFIDDLIKLGLKSVKFTGGEPFLRNDILELIQAASERGLTVSIETNGTNINSKAAKILAKTNTQVSVSLDGSTPELNDKLRNRRGAFTTAINAIKEIKSANGNLKVISAIGHRNFHDLNNIASLINSLGVKGWKINPINNLGNAENGRMENDMFNTLEIFDFFKKIRESNITNQYNISLYLEGPPAFFDLKHIAEAGCGTCPFLNVIGLLADGRISFCGIGYSEESLVLGHISNDKIIEMWKNNPILKSARMQIPHTIGGICKKCVFINSCYGSCRAIAYQQDKSFSTPHPWCSELESAGLFPDHFKLQ